MFYLRVTFSMGRGRRRQPERHRSLTRSSRARLRRLERRRLCGRRRPQHQRRGPARSVLHPRARDERVQHQRRFRRSGGRRRVADERGRRGPLPPACNGPPAPPALQGCGGGPRVQGSCRRQAVIRSTEGDVRLRERHGSIMSTRLLPLVAIAAALFIGGGCDQFARWSNRDLEIGYTADAAGNVERASAAVDTRVVASAKRLSVRQTEKPDVTEIEVEETHFVKGTADVVYSGRMVFECRERQEVCERVRVIAISGTRPRDIFERWPLRIGGPAVHPALPARQP